MHLNDADDLSDVLRLVSADRLDQPVSANVEFFDTSDGGVIMQRRPGLRRPWSVSAAMCTAAEVAWLRAHVGSLVWARDPFDIKVSGAYPQVSISPVPYSDGWYSVSFAITEVPTSEAV